MKMMPILLTLSEGLAQLTDEDIGEQERFTILHYDYTSTMMSIDKA